MPLPILKALSERRGNRSQKIRCGQSLHVILEFLNNFLSYAKGAQILILKALSDRRGNRVQKFSAQRIFARDFIISK